MENVIVMAEAKFEESCSRLEGALISIQRNFIEAGIATVAIKESCGTVQGGSEFPEVMMERFGLSQSAAKELLAIGLNAEKLSAVALSLPRESRSTLYRIAQMDGATIADKIARGVITPTATRDQVLEQHRIQNVQTVKNGQPPKQSLKSHEAIWEGRQEINPSQPSEGAILNWDEVADLSGLSTTEIEAASQDHTDPQFMVATRLKSNRDRLASELSPLAKPERRRVMKAVVSVLQHEQDVFEATAKAAIPQYNKDLQQRLKNEIGKQKKATADVRNRLNEPFDKADFKFIRGVLHSDREATVERKEKAFDLFMKLAPLYE